MPSPIPRTGTIHAGGGNEWFGPAVWTSADLGATWTHSSEGLAYAAGETPIRAVWSLAKGLGGALYAGVEPAGLFRSDDGGARWRHIAGLRDHPSRPHWQPGGGGLILHALVPHPTDERQLWVGISSAGVFHTADGGDTWRPRNSGIRCDYLVAREEAVFRRPQVAAGRRHGLAAMPRAGRAGTQAARPARPGAAACCALPRRG